MSLTFGEQVLIIHRLDPTIGFVRSRLGHKMDEERDEERVPNPWYISILVKHLCQKYTHFEFSLLTQVGQGYTARGVRCHYERQVTGVGTCPREPRVGPKE